VVVAASARVYLRTRWRGGVGGGRYGGGGGGGDGFAVAMVEVAKEVEGTEEAKSAVAMWRRR